MTVYRKTKIYFFVILLTLFVLFLYIRPYLFHSQKNFISNFIVKENLKNRNLQVRKDPKILRVSVGPWNNSTTTNDDNI